ncbi:sugar ABC transporter substrate-binding protein [Cupriavidus sp. WGtm5]|uniref:sugar ABC transporter substrate-binding protein n=1 Tax=Cupriavidus TaxID=106589 RepID=UPI000E10B60F|nr:MULTISPECIES: sugar ABC transporter substrate-binding protein [Cupriavidus]MCO4888456.1 sugar ABC transporter substrate-binding protein [Cupriavidus sp. WGtm5]SPA55954.1 Monosaccharide ABC transporter substrate-binding protein, CUT2 family [Cupriavidus taiwanensis]
MNTRHLKQLAALASFGMLAMTAAHADGERIAVFTKNQTNPYFQALRQGADAAAKGMNAKTTHYIPTKPDSIPEQMSQIEDVVVKKADAVVFVPVDYKAMGPGVKKINAANIPVVNVTDRSDSGSFVAFVGASDYELGLKTATHLFKVMDGKGNLILLEGVKGSATSIDRVRGVKEALKSFPGIKLLASQPANYQRLQALQVMENLMQSYPQIDAVFAANDAMAIGAIEALQGANRKALVSGINGTKEAIDAIKNGTMLATGDYNGFVQGCLGTMTAIRKLRGLPVRQEIVLPATVIDKSNFQALDIPADKRTCPSWEDVSKT